MVYGYFTKNQFVIGYQIHKEEDRPDLIGNPEPPQDMLDNGFTDEDGNYKYTFDGSSINTVNILSYVKTKHIELLKDKAIDLMRNAIILDELPGQGGNKLNAYNFLVSKKAEIQNATTKEDVKTVYEQILTQIENIRNTIVGGL